MVNSCRENDRPHRERAIRSGPARTANPFYQCHFRDTIPLGTKKKESYPMKKVIGNVAIYIFGAFTVIVFGMLVMLTYQALQRIFPNAFENQSVGLVLF